MGYGEVGSNDSVHWKVSHDDSTLQPKYKERDPIDYDSIGRGTLGNKGHYGSFRVRMRFPNVRAAEEALKAALGSILPIDKAGGVYVNCDVPVVAPKRANEMENPLWEIRIDW